jgi:hypothetical protein
MKCVAHRFLRSSTQSENTVQLAVLWRLEELQGDMPTSVLPITVLWPGFLQQVSMESLRLWGLLVEALPVHLFWSFPKDLNSALVPVLESLSSLCQVAHEC